MQMRFLLTALILALSGCASVNTYDMPRVQANVTENVQTAENVVQKSQADFKEKTALVENLKKANGAGFEETELRLRKYLTRMKDSLQAMETHRKAMRESSANIASLAYGKKTVASNDPTYEKISDAVSAFQKSVQDVNEAVLDYTRESNSLADDISNRKLYYNFDVAEFQKRVQGAIKTSQTAQQSMKDEIERSNGVLNNWPDASTRKNQEELQASMVEHAKAYSEKAQRLSEISKMMHTVAQGQGKISTLDKTWPAAQQVIDSLDKAVEELSDIHAKFKVDAEKFRGPARRAQ